MAAKRALLLLALAAAVVALPSWKEMEQMEDDLSAHVKSLTANRDRFREQCEKHSGALSHKITVLRVEAARAAQSAPASKAILESARSAAASLRTALKESQASAAAQESGTKELEAAHERMQAVLADCTAEDDGKSSLLQLRSRTADDKGDDGVSAGASLSSVLSDVKAWLSKPVEATSEDERTVDGFVASLSSRLPASVRQRRAHCGASAELRASLSTSYSSAAAAREERAKALDSRIAELRSGLQRYEALAKKHERKLLAVNGPEADAELPTAEKELENHAAACEAQLKTLQERITRAEEEMARLHKKTEAVQYGEDAAAPKQQVLEPLQPAALL